MTNRGARGGTAILSCGVYGRLEAIDAGRSSWCWLSSHWFQAWMRVVSTFRAGPRREGAAV